MGTVRGHQVLGDLGVQFTRGVPGQQPDTKQGVLLPGLIDGVQEFVGQPSVIEDEVLDTKETVEQNVLCGCQGGVFQSG